MSAPCWLFVDSAAAFGGHEVMLLRWLEELQQQGRIRPILLARADTRLHAQTPVQLAAPTLAAVGTGKLRRTLYDAVRLIAVLLKHKPQLCVVAEGSLLSQVGFTLALRMLNQRTVVYVPLVEPAANMGFGRGALRDRLVRKFYRRVPHAWLTITAEQSRQFAQWAHISAPIFTLPNTVSREIETAGCVTTTTQRPLRVLVLGRLDAHQKGLDGLLDALEAQPALGTDLHISLVGDGPYAAEIRRRVHQSPALQRLLSIQAWTPTVAALSQHDVLLITSRYEGVPLVMLEAMALGVPVIASDLPGTRAMLPANCLFKVGDYQHALHLLLNVTDPAWRSDTTQRNRAAFQQQASGKHFSQSVHTLTDRLLQLSAAPATAVSLPDT